MPSQTANNSIITIQLGQAGNQIGHALFDTISKEYPQYDTFFRRNSNNKRKTTGPNANSTKMVARAIQIDMEPKVIRSMREQSLSSSFAYDDENFLFRQSGSANNWAFGYGRQGPSCRDEITNLIRLELEKSDSCQGFLLMHSVAGGTGSGVGCYVTQLIKDEFQKNLMTNLIVWPYGGGEVIIQNYNVLLSLAKLYEHSDMIMMFENDVLNTVCQKLLGLKRPSFSDMNQVIADSMANFLLPCYDVNVGSGMNYNTTTATNGIGYPTAGSGHNHHLQTSGPRRCELWLDAIEHLCPHPSYKVVTTKTIPIMRTESKGFSTYQWHGLMKHMFQMQMTDAKYEESINWYMNINSKNVNKSVANMLICRGQDIAECTPHLKQFQDARLYADWSMAFDPFKSCVCSQPVTGADKSATMLTNSQSIVNPLENVLSKANQMFHTGAYLHNFEKYGIGKDEFREKFIRMEQVLHDYRELSGGGGD